MDYAEYIASQTIKYTGFDQIKADADAGRTVYWKNTNYSVVKGTAGYFVKFEAEGIEPNYGPLKGTEAADFFSYKD